MREASSRLSLASAARRYDWWLGLSPGQACLAVAIRIVAQVPSSVQGSSGPTASLEPHSLMFYSDVGLRRCRRRSRMDSRSLTEVLLPIAPGCYTRSGNIRQQRGHPFGTLQNYHRAIPLPSCTNAATMAMLTTILGLCPSHVTTARCARPFNASASRRAQPAGRKRIHIICRACCAYRTYAGNILVWLRFAPYLWGGGSPRTPWTTHVVVATGFEIATPFADPSLA